MQTAFPSMLPSSTWKAPRDFPDLSYAKRICVDLETFDPSLTTKGPGGFRGEGFVTGFALGVADSQWYFPIRHSSVNIPIEGVLRWLNDTLSNPAQPKIGANGLYDREWLHASGVETSGTWYDVQIAECLIDEEQDHYSLDALSKKYLGITKNEGILQEAASLMGIANPKACMHHLEARHVAPYAMGDVKNTLEIFEKQLPQLEKERLMPIFQMESELTEVIFHMRRNGVRVDEEGTYRLAKEFQAKEEAIYSQTQFDFFPGQNISFLSNQDLHKLCQQKKWQYQLTEAGNPSFTGDWLEAQNHPFWTAVNRWREINNLRCTFLEGSFLKLAHKGRIHASFQQMRTEEGGTRSGRFACKLPNLQQVPSRMEEAKAIRSLFIPEDGQRWAKIDYSQQEYRLFVHFAMVCGLQGAQEAGNYYIDDENADYHAIVAKMTGLKRSDAKNVNFAILYSAGLTKTASMIKREEHETREILYQYHQAIPFAKELSRDISMRANRRGWIRTLGGRMLHFNFWEPSSKYECFSDELLAKKLNEPEIKFIPKRYEEAVNKWPNRVLKRAGTYKAPNRLIQGSAADMTKFAMLEIYKQTGRVPMMQIHDEVDLSVETKEQALEVKNIMEHVMKLRVPVRAELSLGKSWGEGKKI